MKLIAKKDTEVFIKPGKKQSNYYDLTKIVKLTLNQNLRANMQNVWVRIEEGSSYRRGSDWKDSEMARQGDPIFISASVISFNPLDNISKDSYPIF